MKPVLALNNPQDFIFTDTMRGSNVTPTRKAYFLEFQAGDGRIKNAWVPVSKSSIENGIMRVADWLLEPRRDGIGSLLRAGYTCLQGRTIETPAQLSESEDRIIYKSNVINKGFFTVEVEGDKHRTFKFKTSAKGMTLIGLLIGRNNITDYAWFAYVDGDNLRFWGSGAKYGYPQVSVDLPISHEAIIECFNAIKGNVEGAGLRYATYYKHCSRCGKVLTTPESIEVGKGPECIKLGY